MRLLFLLAIVTSAACLAQNSAASAGKATPAQPATGANTINCGMFAASKPSLDLISKLCGFALTYRAKLPDFIAQQETTSNRPEATVVVNAQVTYYKGQERYSRITINGKPVTPKNPTDLGLRLFASGEFGPLLIDLFEVPGSIQFTFRKTDLLRGVPAARFDFHLPKRKNTFWAIRDFRGESHKPEFHGHLWLEPQTGRIMREQVEPVLNVWQTGVSSMQITVDYSMTNVRDLGSFLLPVRSESTVCLTARLGAILGCTTNIAIFHDYQKFVATGRIVPEDPEP